MKSPYWVHFFVIQKKSLFFSLENLCYVCRSREKVSKKRVLHFSRKKKSLELRTTLIAWYAVRDFLQKRDFLSRKSDSRPSADGEILKNLSVFFRKSLPPRPQMETFFSRQISPTSADREKKSRKREFCISLEEKKGTSRLFYMVSNMVM